MKEASYKYIVQPNGEITNIGDLRRLDNDEQRFNVLRSNETGMTNEELKKAIRKLDPGATISSKYNKENLQRLLATVIGGRGQAQGGPARARADAALEEAQRMLTETNRSAKLMSASKNVDKLNLEIQKVREDIRNNPQAKSFMEIGLLDLQRRLKLAEEEMKQQQSPLPPTATKGRGKTDYNGPMDSDSEDMKPKRARRSRGGMTRRRLPPESYSGYNDEGNELFGMPQPLQPKTELMSIENKHMPILSGNKGLPKIYGMEKKLKMAGFYKPQMKY